MRSIFRMIFANIKVARRVLVYAALPALILLFQNCKPSGLETIVSSVADLKLEGGNGEPYDGKPTYDRLVPGLTCSDNRPAVGSLEIHGDTATIVTNENSCRNVSAEVPVRDLEFSSFSSRYIGYNDGVYTYLENRNENISKGIFTEAWCRAMKADHSGSLFEFAVEWQDLGQFASITLMSETNPTGSTTTGTRDLDLDRVTYEIPNGTLKINFKHLVPGSHKVTGGFYGKIDGIEDQKIQVECLMGGQFDPTAPKFDFPSTTNKTLALGETLTDLTPAVNNSSVRFSLSGILPSGLQFNPQTGSISGTASALMARRKYELSALFPFGKITRQISIGVGKIQTVDQVLSNPASVACSNENTGCDLHGAIALANRMAPLPLIVQIKNSLITLQGEVINITGDVSINGMTAAWPILDAQTKSAHFKVNPGAHLELHHLKMINGNNLEGGSVSVTEGSLLVKNTVFSKNQAGENLTDGKGGAIFARKSILEVIGSEFTENHTPQSGGGGGGAIYTEQSLSTVIKNSLFRKNTGISGGAIHIFAGNSSIFEIINCSFELNYAMKGGAIYSQFSETSIEKSRFIRNTSAFDGGAIQFISSNRAWIRDSLFDGNDGTGFGSAAIYWQGYHWSGYQGAYSPLYLLESKFINHKANFNSAAVLLNHLGHVVMRGTVFEQNGALISCKSLAEAPYAEYFSLGDNQSSDGSCLQ